MFKTLQVISKEECNKIYSKLQQYENFISKVNDNGISTFGAASYLHCDDYLGELEEIDFSKPIGSDKDFTDQEVTINESEDACYPLHVIDYENKQTQQQKIYYPDHNLNLYRYYDKLKLITNPILYDNFQDLYQKICQTIENEINEKCSINLDTNLALPGFNIFTPYDGCEKVDVPPHIDLQWTYHLDALKQIFKTVSEERFLTFTLAVKLPKSGAGLYVWSLEDDKIKDYNSAKKSYKDIILICKNLLNKNKSIDRQTFEKEANPSFIDYKEGQMTLFDNLLLHQVAPFNTPYELNEERITLQGHGIKCDGIWRFFF